MNIRELQQAYENRIKDVRGYIYKQTRDDEDLRQEACTAMWRGLMKDPVATNGYLMNRIKWRLMDVWKNGTSVDKPNKKWEGIKILRLDPQDLANGIFVEFFENNKQPLDEQVINKIDTERFFQSLDYIEQKIVFSKLEGRYDKDIIKELPVSRERYKRIKRGLKPKIIEFFAV